MTPFQKKLHMCVCLIWLMLIGQAIVSKAALAQTALQPDQYEPNQTDAMAKFIGEFKLTSDPTANSVQFSIEANLHTETDQDWYVLKLLDEGIPPACVPHVLRVGLWLSASTSGPLLDVYNFGGSISPVNLSALPVGAHVGPEFFVSSCGFALTPRVRVSRGAGSLQLLRLTF
jgi:hypothetical protein